MKLLSLFIGAIAIFAAASCIVACMQSSRISEQEEKDRFKEDIWKKNKEDFSS